MRGRDPVRRADFLMRNGWEPITWCARPQGPPITMWTDPLTTPGPGGGTRRRIL